MEIRPPSTETGVSQGTRDKIILALWLPVVFVLNGAALAVLGVGVGILGIGVRMAVIGDLPDPSVLSDVAGIGAIAGDQTTLLVVGAALLGLYWLLAHATFGTDTVQESIESAEEAKQVREDGGGKELPGGDRSERDRR